MRRGIAELLDEFEQSRNVGRDPRVGPSDYGKCTRQVAYRVRGHEPGEPREQTRAATMGTLFWLGLGAHIEKTHDDAWVEYRVAVPGLERDGSSDLIWLFDGELVDVKTVSGRAFDYVLTMGAKDENIGQVETYALGLNRDSEMPIHGDRARAIETLTLAYVNRDNGDVHEISWAYDEDVARSKVSELVQLEEMIDAGFEMPRAEGARLGAFPCDWCPFWRECWDVDDDDVPDTYASKFTTTDPQIEDALERYFENGAVESKAKRLKAEAREQLVGITYVANGYSLKWSGGRTTYVDEIDYDELVVLAVESGLSVPMKSVAKTRARTINARRVQSS